MRKSVAAFVPVRPRTSAVPVSFLAKGDTLIRKPVCTVPGHKAAGRYTISCSGASADAKKYTIRYVNAPFYVGKAPLVVAASYTQKYYAAADPTRFAYATAGLVAGDKFVTAPTCGVDEPHTDVGRYVIDCSGADAGPNYTIRYLAHYYDVLKSPLIVGPTRQYAYYGSPDPDFTYSTYGLKDGETLETEPTCEVAAPHVHVGTYTISCTGAEADPNYDLYVVDDEYTVVQTYSYVVGSKPVIRQGLFGPTSGKLVATLYAYFGQGPEPAAGETVAFTSGGTALCTAVVTDSAGQATCSLGANAAKLVRNGGYTVAYAGTDDIAGSHHDVDNG